MFTKSNTAHANLITVTAAFQFDDYCTLHQSKCRGVLIGEGIEQYDYQGIMVSL